MTNLSRIVCPVVVCMLAVACSSSSSTSDNAANTSAAASTTTQAQAGTTVVTTLSTTPDTEPAAESAAIAGYRSVVETLASDEFAGRNNLTDGSVRSQEYLIAQLKEFAQPLGSGVGDDAYKQTFDLGTNLLAVIPGGELAEQYVIVGAHYDHLGNDCDAVSATDSICNGATDNATGVAAALAIGRSIAADATGPRRSVIIAFWDAEEDGLKGSAAYIANPVVPLAKTVGYVNFDIQGANLTPSLRNLTVMVGAETGGQTLIDAALQATSKSSLDTAAFSLLFGQGRSDHANFAVAGVPTVFFTDANPPCYHTVGDDTSIVDYPKLEQQVVTAEALTRDLMSTDTPPVFDPTAPPASFDDAVTMLSVLHQGEPDFDRFGVDNATTARKFVADLTVIVDAGAPKFDATAVGVLLAGSVSIVRAVASGACEGFLATP